MGFFLAGSNPCVTAINGVSLDTIHRHQCRICPLNPQTGESRTEPLAHPFMAATGADHPSIYMLGEAPGADEDAEGTQFVGRAGTLLRFRVPWLDHWSGNIRWNNVVRTRPPGNRDPSPLEIECCRPSIIADIEQSAPEAIFGFGNVPLNWLLPNLGRDSGIMKWRGRRVPVRVGNHACWYFPMVHPSACAHVRRFEPRHRDEWPSDLEFAFAKDLERAFRAVEHGLPPPVVTTTADLLTDVGYVTGHNFGDLVKVIDAFREASTALLVGIDYETNRLRPYEAGAAILSVGIATPERAFAFPLYHRGAGWNAASLTVIENTLSTFLHQAPANKISFALPFEMEWSAYFYGAECLRSGTWEDAQSQAYVLDERSDTMSLQFAMRLNFGVDFKAISNVDVLHLDDTPIDEVLRYNALDAKAHLMLYEKQERALEQEHLSEVYTQQRRRAAAMVSTQLQGLPVDQPTVERFIGKYENQRDEAATRLNALPEISRFHSGTKKAAAFNPGSPQHIRKLLTSLGYEGVSGTDEAALAAINHPVAAAIVAWRKPSKVLSTYLYPCRVGSEKTVVMPDGMLHPVYNITKVKTWRTSASDPNIQNFYKRMPEYSEIRAVVQGPDLRVVAFDYAGIQARNVAMESRDPVLVEAFRHRYDIHADWRDRIAAKCPYWMGAGADAKAFRHLAKNRFVFPSFFGARPAKLAAGLGIDEQDAADVQAEFWEAFPGVRDWHDRQLAFYRKHGYVTGCSGFRRRAPASVNELINAPIQADEAVIVVTAMCALSELEDPRYQPAMEIHDDLTFLWPAKDIEKNAEIVIKTMLDTPYEWAHIVPIEVEMSVGTDWHNLKPVGAYASDTWNGTISK